MCNYLYCMVKFLCLNCSVSSNLLALSFQDALSITRTVDWEGGIWWAYQKVFIPWSPNWVGPELMRPWNDDVSNHCLLRVVHTTNQADGVGNRWINILDVEVWMSGYTG
jgi:hypothetical protein